MKRSTVRPLLNKIDLKATLRDLYANKPGLYITMSVGQWDETLKQVYVKGGILIELDSQEVPVAAYRSIA